MILPVTLSILNAATLPCFGSVESVQAYKNCLLGDIVKNDKLVRFSPVAICSNFPESELNS